MRAAFVYAGGSPPVMAALVPAIHAFSARPALKARMAARTRP